MDFHLEKEIRLYEESENKGLYSWSLQEFDKKGKKDGSDQIPWNWTLYFMASELRHCEDMTAEMPEEPPNEKLQEFMDKFQVDTPDEDKQNEEDTSDKRLETISGSLHSGRCFDGSLDREVAYSMFGTDRQFKDFSLKIMKLNDREFPENCTLWGCVSYSAETDFRYEKQDDFIEVHIWLKEEKFNDLAEAVKNKRVDMASLSLGQVAGFYSEWSPSISTNRVKVLAQMGDQKIIRPDGVKMEPPTLGRVGEFSLTIVQRNLLNPKQDTRPINIDKLFYPEDFTDKEEEDNEKYAEPKPEMDPRILSILDRNGKILKQLRTPLWLIFIILLLYLFK